MKKNLIPLLLSCFFSLIVCACHSQTVDSSPSPPHSPSVPHSSCSLSQLDLDGMTFLLLHEDSVTLSRAKSIVSPSSGNGSSATPESLPLEEASLTKDQYFADTLFIGDSRTVGLQDYAELDTATFFAYSGLSSFSAFKKSLEIDDMGNVTLEELLTARSFGKIYVMLGINELGYPFSSIVSKYTQMIRQIHSLQPQSTILLCANLRVVADGKEVRDYIANDNINQLNAEIAALADGDTYFYIDVNPLFDDGSGALDPQYCADDLHPYGKYYYQWGEWLYKVGVPNQ